MAGEQSAVDSAAKWAAGAFTVVTAALGAVGATGGGLERILRNELRASLFAFGLIFFGIVVAVLSRPAIPLFGGTPWVNTLTLVLAFGLFALGLGRALFLGVVSPSVRERPQISASLTRDDGLLLEATVRASGMSSDDSLIVIIDGLAGVERVGTRLYKSQMGPERDGSVDVPLKVEIPSAGFDEVAIAASFDGEEREKCLDGTLTEACVIVRLPAPPRGPQLSLDLEGDPATRTAVVQVAGSGIAREGSVFVTAAGIAGKTRTSALSSVLVPDGAGRVDSSFRVPVPSQARRFCVVALPLAIKPTAAEGWRVTMDATHSCPPAIDEGVAWASLRLRPPP
ncbi:MAG: hypothetical protein M3271_00940 [Actinomycetota bacterium]|nr:hypothetical protein [Actinomycetota bacterium]